MKKKLKSALEKEPIRFAADMVNIYFTKRVSRSSAELAYFLILTFFPILICLSAFMGKLNLSSTALLDNVLDFLPEGVTAIFEEYLAYVNGNLSTPMLITGIVLAVLFASAAVRGLMNIMREIYGRGTFQPVGQFIASLVFSVLLLATIYLSLAVVVTGNWFFHLLGNLLGLEDLVDRFGTWQWIKYLFLLAVVFLFILLLYRFVAPLKKPRPSVVWGALLAAIALAAASMLFSFFMSRSTRYSLIYGSLASVIILLVWLYLCGNILILGSAFNYVLDSHRHKRKKD